MYSKYFVFWGVLTQFRCVKICFLLGFANVRGSVYFGRGRGGLENLTPPHTFKNPPISGNKHWYCLDETQVSIKFLAKIQQQKQ